MYKILKVSTFLLKLSIKLKYIPDFYNTRVNQLIIGPSQYSLLVWTFNIYVYCKKVTRDSHHNKIHIYILFSQKINTQVILRLEDKDTRQCTHTHTQTLKPQTSELTAKYPAKASGYCRYKYAITFYVLKSQDDCFNDKTLGEK